MIKARAFLKVREPESVPMLCTKPGVVLSFSTLGTFLLGLGTISYAQSSQACNVGSRETLTETKFIKAKMVYEKKLTIHINLNKNSRTQSLGWKLRPPAVDHEVQNFCADTYSYILYLQGP
nr:hypothetical protein Iba_chr11cCG8370 [Ipomoea batatas]